MCATAAAVVRGPHDDGRNMTLRPAPPLWKAIIVYYAIACGVFASIGIFQAGGSPAGALLGIGILAAAHVLPLARPPDIDPGLALVYAAVACAAVVLALRFIKGWLRIGIVVTGLLAWLVWGFATIASSA